MKMFSSYIWCHEVQSSLHNFLIMSGFGGAIYLEIMREGSHIFHGLIVFLRGIVYLLLPSFFLKGEVLSPFLLLK